MKLFKDLIYKTLKLKYYKIILFITLSIFNFPINPETPVLVSSKSTLYNKVLAGIQYSAKTPLKIFYMEDLPVNWSEKTLFGNENTSGDKTLITVGNRATQEARTKTKVRNLFTMVSFSRSTIKYELGSNCGLFSDVSLEKLFLLIREIKVEARNVYMFYSLPTGNYYTEVGRDIDFMHGFIFRPVFVSETSTLEKELEKAKDEIHAIVLQPDPLFDKENFSILSEFAKKKQIPLIANFNSLTELGIGMSLDIDYYGLGVQTGNLLNDLNQQKTKCNFGPYSFPKNEFLKINEDYLKESNLEIPKSLHFRMELDELNQSGIDLYSKRKTGSAFNVFQYALNRDPDNELANFYSTKITSEKYNSKIYSLMEEASLLMNQEKYTEASILYSKVLSINANYPVAKEKYTQSIFLASEKKRKEGDSFQKKGSSFQAISSYLSALKIDSTNRDAKISLEKLRRDLKTKLPEMHQLGEKYYNTRSYENACANFENILLIQPDDKKAIEYLRISKAKRDALEKLKNCSNNKESPCAL